MNNEAEKARENLRVVIANYRFGDHLNPDESAIALDTAKNLLREVERLDKQLNTPEVIEFAQAVPLEAAHQREKWGSDHDTGKTDEDWNWTLGYLIGKSMRGFSTASTLRKMAAEFPTLAEMLEEMAAEAYEKGLHHLITSAALLANWHSARVGGAGAVMRPGIDASKGEV